jgi:hypothetical protein
MEQAPHLLLDQHWHLTAASDVLGFADRMRWVDGEPLPEDKPVEQHADRGKVLLDRCLGGGRLQRRLAAITVKPVDWVEAISCIATR